MAQPLTINFSLKFPVITVSALKVNTHKLYESKKYYSYLRISFHNLNTGFFKKIKNKNLGIYTESTLTETQNQNMAFN